MWSFDAKKVFGAKQVGKIQIPDFTLSVGQKNEIYFCHQKVVMLTGRLKESYWNCFWVKK